MAEAAGMFPSYTEASAKKHLATLDPEIFDQATGMISITYQTYSVRTKHQTILIDTCTGEDKGYPPPMDFPKQRYLEEFKAAGLSFEKIDYVFCTHLHIDHCGWNTVLRNGRWVPTFPNAEIRLPRARIRGLGAGDQGAENSARQRLALQLRTDRRGRAGVAGRRRLCAGR